MNPLPCDESIRVHRQPGRCVYLAAGISLEQVEDALRTPGSVLKRSSKALVRRVGNWVVKESHGPWFTELIRHTARKSRYRRAWIAAHHLRRHGVLVPSPIAFMEYGGCGFLTGNRMISEYLDGLVNVEKFVHEQVKRGVEKEALRAFFEHLAGSVNRFSASGAYHEDLSGKNIFTQDGRRFYFIDLDAVALGRPVNEARRLINHVQLYDSFCDFADQDLLAFFIGRMTPSEYSFPAWIDRVRAGQHARRDLYARRRTTQQKEPSP